MITACLATIPERDCTPTINSLKNQVDQLIVVHNFSKQSNELWGDAAKFVGLINRKGYLLTCDDDLIYPKDYVFKMIEAVDRYGRKKIITLHGRTFPKRKITSYYRDKTDGFRCLGTVENDTKVDSGGTGVMAWHSSLFNPGDVYFGRANMADIWIARYAKENQIEIVCLKHEDGWLKYIQQPENSTIWEKKINDDSYETKIFNSFWC